MNAAARVKTSLGPRGVPYGFSGAISPRAYLWREVCLDSVTRMDPATVR